MRPVIATVFPAKAPGFRRIAPMVVATAAAAGRPRMWLEEAARRVHVAQQTATIIRQVRTTTRCIGTRSHCSAQTIRGTGCKSRAKEEEWGVRQKTWIAQSK